MVVARQRLVILGSADPGHHHRFDDDWSRHIRVSPISTGLHHDVNDVDELCVLDCHGFCVVGLVDVLVFSWGR